MDRRQRKTREAIFNAFIAILSKKDFNCITVGEIIEKADIGRATFYAHFETKDFLLKELCEELFCHLFDSLDKSNDHRHIFDCEAPDSIFLHLFQHFEKNDNNILALLAGQNNDLFLRYFKENLQKLIESQISVFDFQKNKNLPESFRINHISSVFVETVRWWVRNGMKENSETITEYFFLSL